MGEGGERGGEAPSRDDGAPPRDQRAAGGAPASHHLAADRTAIPPLARHLILIGLPGSGKSSVGRRVARELGVRFVDLDELIERRAGLSIARIFADVGEARFRELEAELSAELAAEPPAVLAPGGGWAANEAAVAPLRPVGRIIYLRVTPESAVSRMGAGRETRPLLAGPDPVGAVDALLASRRAAYARADTEVDTEGLSLQQVTSAVAAIATADPGY